MKNDRLFSDPYILLERQRVTAPELSRLLEFRWHVTGMSRPCPWRRAGLHLDGQGGGISLSPLRLRQGAFVRRRTNQVIFALQSLQATDQIGGLLKSWAQLPQGQRQLD
jgi:hypothetical protein